MAEPRNAPDATIRRLSLYHCYLGELLRVGAPVRITSHQLEEDLGIKEETVRRDVSFVGAIGRSGAGYEPRLLFDAFGEYLGLVPDHPFIRIGSAEMLRALGVVFPVNRFGVKPVAYFSENPEDSGVVVDGIEIRHITALHSFDPGRRVSVALVACSPGWVQVSVDILARAGISGVLLLTPAVRVKRPEGMTITYVHMPCSIKSLAFRCRPGRVEIGG